MSSGIQRNLIAARPAPTSKLAVTMSNAVFAGKPIVIARRPLVTAAPRSAATASLPKAERGCRANRCICSVSVFIGGSFSLMSMVDPSFLRCIPTCRQQIKTLLGVRLRARLQLREHSDQEGNKSFPSSEVPHVPSGDQMHLATPLRLIFAYLLLPHAHRKQMRTRMWVWFLHAQALLVNEPFTLAEHRGATWPC